MKIKKSFIFLLTIVFSILLISCDNENGNGSSTETKIKVLSSSNSLVGKQYEEVVSSFESWGFTNIETIPIYDIVWGFTKPGSTKSIKIGTVDKFKSGDLFNKDIEIIITYSMPVDDNPEKQKYTITWMLDDETILKEDKVLWGEIPIFKGNTPSKTSTNEFKYTFSGWSPEVVKVTEDTTYKAIFTKEKMTYQLSYLIPDPIEQIISGGVHRAVITESGQVYTWGMNFYGQLGNGTTRESREPVNITEKFELNNEEKIVKIVSGSHHNIALTSIGRIFTWGKKGVLGDGTSENKLLPNEITDNFSLKQNEIITDIFTNERADHSIAITSKGAVYTWGDNSYGQLGDGTTRNKLSPVNITSYFVTSSMENSVFSLGSDHTLALLPDGQIYSWGRNNKGQLGTGTKEDSQLPLHINNKFNISYNEKIISINVSLYHSQALTDKGNLYSWGTGDSGQHGDGTYVDKFLPIKVTSYFNLNSGERLIKSYSVGSHTFAISSLHRVFGWGHNLNGQSGDGTTISKAIPIDITSMFNVKDDEFIIDFAGGFYDSIAISSLGRVFTWGDKAASSPTEDLTGINNYSIIKTVEYFYNEKIIEYRLVLDGFTFVGWYLDDKFSISYTFETMGAEDIKLYAKLIKN